MIRKSEFFNMCSTNALQLRISLVELINNGHPATVGDHEHDFISLRTWQEVDTLIGLLNERGMDGFEAYADLVNAL